jgi:RNA polymerase sigma-B factor
MHTGLAYSVAQRFRGCGEEIDDLRQVALIALLQAIERFEPKREIAFSTFAVPTIDGALKRHLRDRTWTIRPPRAVHDRSAGIDRAVEDLTWRFNRAPTRVELRAHLGCSDSELHDAQTARTNRACESITAVNDRELAKHEPGYDRAEDRAVLAQLF